MLLKTNKHLPFTFLLLVGMLLGHTSCRRNLETSNQGRHTPTTNSQGSPTPKKPDKAGKIPIEEALPDALIGRVKAPLQKILREVRKNPATIDEAVPRGGYQIQWTVLQLAAAYDELEVLQALLQAGADPNAKSSDNTDRTALHYAVQVGHLEVVKALIAAGADINQTANDGNTPLHIAVSLTFLPWCRTQEELEAEIEEVVKLLIQYPEINLNLKNNRGETALDIASRRRFYDWSIPDILKQCAAK